MSCDHCECGANKAEQDTAALRIALVGNPNSGKTTLFNALTGSRQHVGNWPGVTVERKSGYFEVKHSTVEVVDLPGTYSLTEVSDSSSIDECIACEYILNREASVVVNVIDASNLERNLYLTMQLLEMNVPVIVALNMMDVAKDRGVAISLSALSKELDCPVVALEARKGKGLSELKNLILSCVVPRLVRGIQEQCMDPADKPRDDVFAVDKMVVPYPALINEAIADLNAQPTHGCGPAIRLLESDKELADVALQATVSKWQNKIRQELNEDPDILVADARYRCIGNIMQQVVTQTKNNKPITQYIDNIVLNRILGIPIFLAIMYCMFLFAINVGGAFQDFFDISSNTIFVQGFAQLLHHLHAPEWLIALLAEGVGKGINTTLTFIPVIGAMFLFLAFLEDSGYMARAAFVVDRLMRALGLPGKSFVPMIVGFGCNVPSVMAARTLENKRDRILTVMMSPFMSCGARLAIYAVFTAAFFPVGGQNVVFSLYLIGIIMAVLTGLLLRKTVLQGEPAPLVMEMPSYHVPHLKSLTLRAWQRLKGFVFRAGKLILPICVLIGAMNAINLDGTLNSGDGDSQSLLSALGRAVTPIFAPMGIHQDNWPATVGLVTGVLAKEVVIGTLNTLYSQAGHLVSMPSETFNFWGGLQSAAASIPANLSQLTHSLGNPVLAQAPVHTLTQQVYGLMYQQFDGQIGAMAYLLFVLLYFPCVSTVAAMARELHRGWAIFSMLWTTGIAYCVAVGFYQLATFVSHPLSSSLWIAGVLSTLLLTIITIRLKYHFQWRRYEFT